MHVQIAAGQTGEGPIYVTVADDDDSMRFRDLSISFSSLHRLIDAAYLDIAALLPGNDVNSAPGQAGMPTISMSATITEHQPGKPPRRVL